MKPGIFILLQLGSLLFMAGGALAVDQSSPELNCSQGALQMQYSSGACQAPDWTFPPSIPESSLPFLPGPVKKKGIKSDRSAAPDKAGRAASADKKIIIYFFRGQGCPHCEEEKEFLEGKKRKQPALEVRDYEVWYNRENARLMALMLRASGVQSSGVPVTFVGTRMFSGFTPRSMELIEKEISRCSLLPCGDPAELIRSDSGAERSHQDRRFKNLSAATTAGDTKENSINLPFFGDLDSSNSPLPLLTLIIAGMDSFNPCAFFVLLTLLGMLAHAHSRNKMLLVGGIFVFFSGSIYFLFMAAWLNLFLVMGHVAIITSIAGYVSVIIAAINIKDFFLFKLGVSLSIPDNAKPKLFERMRKLLRSDSLVSILIGTTVLAVVANFYELLCTAGFPMVFTRILTLHKLSPPTYYLYLALYNIVYVAPMFIIVLGLSLTLGNRKLSEWQGRLLKLTSGTMMLGLGIILLINPALLNSLLVSFILLVSALCLSLLIATLTKRSGY